MNEGKRSYAVEMQMADATWQRIALISSEEDDPLELVRQTLVDYVVTSPLIGYRIVPISDDELSREH